MSDLGTRHQYHGLQPVIRSSDLDASLAFYRDTLDFDVDFVQGSPPSYARLCKGDRTYGDPVYIHVALSSGKDLGTAKLRIHVGHDVDGLCDALVARGVVVESGPTTQPWGLREFTVRDPDGNQLCFCGYASAD